MNKTLLSALSTSSACFFLVALAATMAASTAIPARADEPHRLVVDFSESRGVLRPLHGINMGPLSPNGLVDLTEAHKLLRVPITRLHDCHNPNPDVVDIHAVFPNPDADPARPESYDFRATDEYIAAIRKTGAEIVYRLGQSIEHQTVKRHVHPPRDPERWAAVCAGIVRHYNEGWAEGFRYDIPYWEIWNEPENRPVMWTGTDEQFLELYRITARTLRAEFPRIKIGGPGFGYYGKFDGRELEPSEFCVKFLDLSRRESLPLDFFSWHAYTNDPAEPAARARAVRRMLDSRGFTKTESHFNEWNYLPDNSWDILSRTATPEMRQQAVDRMVGAPGGAYLVATLICLEDAPVDVSNFYHGQTGIFGLFTEVGAPTRNYHAMLAFARMLETPERVKAEGGVPSRLALVAGTDATKTKVAILVGNLSGAEDFRLSIVHLPWHGETEVEVLVVDEGRALAPIDTRGLVGSALEIRLPPPAVALITLRPRDADSTKAPNPPEERP